MAVKSVAPPSHLAVLPTWCLAHPLFRNGRALQVLFAYCAHADKTGITRCSQERIAVLLGVSRQLVSRYVQRLEAAGILRVYYRRHVGQGRLMKIMQVVFDPKSSATPADLRSIAQPSENPGQLARPTQHQTVAQLNGYEGNLSTILSDLRNTQDVAQVSSATLPDGPTQHVSTSDLRNTQTVAQNCELIKELRNRVQNADEVIRQWLAFAWAHGKHTPIADETDLATAHALVAKGVTLEQLERAVIQDPEADELAPIVRSLLA